MKPIIALSCILWAALALAQSAPQQPANQLAEPTQLGVYYKSPTQYVKMDQTTMVGGGAKHIGKMFVPGLTPQMVYTFREAHSPLKISESKPTFKLSDRAFSIVPIQDLKPGEYLVTFGGSGAMGWDFGVPQKEK